MGFTKGTRRKDLTIGEKRRIVDFLDSPARLGLTNDQLIQRLNITKAILDDCVKRADIYRRQDPANRLYRLTYRNSKFYRISRLIREWIMQSHMHGVTVKTSLIRQRSQEVAQRMGIVNFKSSEGWMKSIIRKCKMITRMSSSPKASSVSSFDTILEDNTSQSHDFDRLSGSMIAATKSSSNVNLDAHHNSSPFFDSTVDERAIFEDILGKYLNNQEISDDERLLLESEGYSTNQSDTIHRHAADEDLFSASLNSFSTTHLDQMDPLELQNGSFSLEALPSFILDQDSRPNVKMLSKAEAFFVLDNLFPTIRANCHSLTSECYIRIVEEIRQEWSHNSDEILKFFK